MVVSSSRAGPQVDDNVTKRTSSPHSIPLERHHVPWDERLREEKHQPSEKIGQHVL